MQANLNSSNCSSCAHRSIHPFFSKSNLALFHLQMSDRHPDVPHRSNTDPDQHRFRHPIRRFTDTSFGQRLQRIPRLPGFRRRRAPKPATHPAAAELAGGAVSSHQVLRARDEPHGQAPPIASRDNQFQCFMSYRLEKESQGHVMCIHPDSKSSQSMATFMDKLNRDILHLKHISHVNKVNLSVWLPDGLQLEAWKTYVEYSIPTLLKEITQEVIISHFIIYPHTSSIAQQFKLLSFAFGKLQISRLRKSLVHIQHIAVCIHRQDLNRDKLVEILHLLRTHRDSTHKLIISGVGVGYIELWMTAHSHSDSHSLQYDGELAVFVPGGVARSRPDPTFLKSLHVALETVLKGLEQDEFIVLDAVNIKVPELKSTACLDDWNHILAPALGDMLSKLQRDYKQNFLWTKLKIDVASEAEINHQEQVSSGAIRMIHKVTEVHQYKSIQTLILKGFGELRWPKAEDRRSLLKSESGQSLASVRNFHLIDYFGGFEDDR